MTYMMHGQPMSGNLTGLQFTPKVAPSFDGRTAWSAFEEAIDAWLNITTLTPNTWAPSLNSKTGRRSQHLQTTFRKKEIERPQRGRILLQKRTEAALRERTGKRVHIQVLPISEFLQMLKDLQTCMGRLQVLRKRILDAWMDTFLADPAENVDFQAGLQAENAQLQADGLNAQQQALLAGLQPPPIVLFTVQDALEIWKN